MTSGNFRLLAGLGNPGSKYIFNRHNIGFMALERLANKNRIDFKEKNKLNGSLAEFRIEDTCIRLLKPNTFMNNSGKSIKATLDWFGLSSDDLIVIVDDMDLPFGKLRIRTKGGCGGHNGLKSTIDHLGTENFCRLRIGIGSPLGNPEDRKRKTINHVLGNFSFEESETLTQILDEIVITIDQFYRINFDKVCSRINSYKLNQSEE